MKRQRIGLSEHFTYQKILRFTLPSVIMAVFTSVYSIVDGVFVSKAVGDAAFAGLNLIFPFIMILGAVGLMIGSGGSALIAKTLGEGDRERALGYFSFFAIAISLLGVLLGGIGIAVVRPVAELLGRDASAEAVQNGVLYGTVLLAGLPFLMLQFCFQSFMVTAEKPMLGFLVTVAAGITNAALDALFILGFRWGLAGAAAATVVGQAVGGIAPIVYFARRNNASLLRFAKPRFEAKAFFQACANGSSELLSNISFSLVSILFNVQLLRLAGDNGIIAYGIIMYMSNIFFNIFFGFSMGIAPVVGYHFGAENRDELKNLRKKCFVVIAVLGIALTGLSEALAIPFARIFATTEEVFLLTRNGVWLYSFAYLLMGVSVFGSAFFTALNNGLVSASISFIRSFVFQCGMILLMPVLLGMNGVWLSAVFADIFACAVTITFFLAMRKKYGY